MAVVTEHPHRLLHDARWAELVRGTLYDVLPPAAQSAIRKVHARYPLTVQETRLACEAARDLEMWGEPGLEEWWRQAEAESPASPQALPDGAARSRKRQLLQRLREHTDGLRDAATRYPAGRAPQPQRPPLHVVAGDPDGEVFGDCPVRSERTLCCNLKTIDAVKNCAFGCSYCTIQTFYGDRVALDPNVTWFLEPGRRVPPNVVCSWSLNTDPVVAHEEHFTASLE